MKITRIELNDFRAFAQPESFDLGDGKNVLLYGANGAGKSSLFRALREIFNHASTEPFSANKNIFTDPARTDGYVRLHFSPPPAPVIANVPVDWPFLGPRAGADQRIVQGALRMGSLDYRSLLDTNYVFKDGEINLFDVLVKGILRPWLVIAGARGLVRLGTLWEEALDKRIPTPNEQYQAHLVKGGGAMLRTKNQTQSRINAANNTANVFNDALRINLRKIVLLGNRLLRRLGVNGLSFVLTSAPVVYVPEKRAFSPQRIDIRVRFNGVDIPRPQAFLNEARLSALALSLYFAALLKVVPNDPAWPRVLVLDDVLIGLDMDNRLPILDILRHEFRDWQVFLITHDRTWFEVAQIATVPDDQWLSFEMHPRPRQDGNRVYDVPWIRPPVAKPKELKTVADQHIAQAKTFLAVNDDRTAAFHTRVAFEAKLKSYAHAQKIPVRYMLDGRRLDTDEFLDAIEATLKSEGKHISARFDIERIKVFRRGVLNPYAHYHPVTITASEVGQAIRAVEKLDLYNSPENFARKTALALTPAMLLLDDSIDAACWLRTAFEVDLRDMLVRLNGNVTFRHDWSGMTLAELWLSAKAGMRSSNAGLATPLITNIELHPAIFLDEFSYTRVSIFTKPGLDAAWAILRDSAHLNPIKTRLASFP